MMNRVRGLAQTVRQPMFANAYALVANQGISAALGLVYWPLAAHLYGSKAYGTDSAVISVILLVSAIAQLGLGGGMVRFVPRAGDKTRRLVELSYAAVIATAALLGVLVVALSGVFGIRGLLGTGPLVWVWVVLASVLWSIFRLQDQVLIGLRQAKWVLAENTIFNVSKLAMLVLLVSVAGAHGIVWSWFGPTPLVIALVTWLVFAVYTRRGRLVALPEGQTAPTLREVIATSGGDHIGALSSEAASRLLPVLIFALLGAEANARFYSAWVIATTLGLIAGAMTDSFTAQTASDRANVGRYSRDIMRHMAALMLPVAVVLGLGAPYILAIFGKGIAAQATTLLQLLCLSAPLILFNTWYLSFARVMGRIRQAVWVQVVGAVLLLGGSYALLRPLGILGVGVAWMASQIVLAIYGALDARAAFAGTARVSGVPAS